MLTLRRGEGKSSQIMRKLRSCAEVCVNGPGRQILKDVPPGEHYPDNAPNISKLTYI